MICFQLMDVFQELANVRKLFTMATKGRPDPSVTPGVHFSFGFSCSLFPWGSFERMNKPNFSNIRPSLFRRCGSLCIFIEIDITRFCRFTQLEQQLLYSNGCMDLARYRYTHFQTQCTTPCIPISDRTVKSKEMRSMAVAKSNSMFFSCTRRLKMKKKNEKNIHLCMYFYII